MDINLLLKILANGENEKVEFKKKISRDIGEEIVALSNVGGGYIIVGVDDDGKIVGCNVNDAKRKITDHLISVIPPVNVRFYEFNIDGKHVLVVEVEESKTLATIGGIAYIRIGTSKRPLSISEIISLGTEYTIMPVDSMRTDIKASEMDKNIWRWFLKKRGERGLKSVKNLKEKLGIVKKLNDETYLTLAGLLFFHRNPQNIMPHTYIRLKYGDTWERIDGPIWSQVEKTVKRLLEIIPKRSILKGIERIEEPAIPIEVLREAIVNAVVHRNYSIFSEIFIEYIGNTLEIKNPGSFPPGSTPENPKPIPRNPVLYELMFEAGYVERQGGGIEMMKEKCREYGIHMTYDISPYYTRLKFEFPLVEVMDEIEKKVLSLLTIPRSSSEIARALNLSKPTILKRLKILERRGLVKCIGRGARTKWVIS